MALKVENFEALSKTFKHASKDVRLAYRKELRTIAEPTRRLAESLAATRIRNLAAGDPWTKFRTGVTQKVVYVAPRQKGTHGRGRRRRRNMGSLLASRVTNPAIEAQRGQIERDFEQMLDRLVNKWDHDGP